MGDVVGFAQFPARAPAPGVSRLGTFVDVGLRVALVAAPGAVLSERGWSGAAAVVAVGLAVVASVRTVLSRGAAVAVVAAGVATIAVGAVAGRPAGAAFALGALVLARLTATEVAGDVPDRRLQPAAGLAVVAAIVAWRSGGFLPALVVQAASLLIVQAPRQVVDAAVGAVDRGVAAFARILLRTAFALLGLVLVLLPWLVGRVVAWDPTWTRRRPGSRLVEVRDRPLDGRRQWSSTTSVQRPGVRRRLHAAALTTVPLVAAAVAVVLVASATSGSDAAESSGVEEQTAALDGSPWWESARPAQLATYDEAIVTGFSGPRLADVATEYTNVVDGRRRTWQAPATPRLTVWMFGGSTAFGMGQRDDHTIASELARSAWQDGLALDVVNWGVHGDVHWMEWNRLSDALQGGEAPPDYVIFYDGFNELTTVSYVNDQGRAAGRGFLGSVDAEPLGRGDALDRFARRIASITEDRGLQPSPPTSVLTPDEVVEMASRQFADSVATSRAGLDALAIPGVVVYQPSRLTRASLVDGEGDDGAESRALERSFRSRLPDGVVDLSGALDATPDPVYWDSVHHNELGSRVIAAALWDEIGADVASLAEAAR